MHFLWIIQRYKYFKAWNCRWFP